MPFLTKSNSLKVIARIDFKKIGNLEGDVYNIPIYLFSDYEKNNLLGLKEFLKNPQGFIKEFYVPIQNTDNLKYVFEGGKPAYHLHSKCSRLNSDFRNFEVPEEIRDRGSDEVTRFRDWFKKNQKLLENPEKFVLELAFNFQISVNPKSIEYDNSGIEIKENLNLEELETRINKYISDASDYFVNADFEKQDIIQRFKKHTFLAYSPNKIINNNTRFKDETIKKFLKQYDKHFKQPLKDLLFEYYKIKHNPDLKFEGLLLEQLGFKQCALCYGELLDLKILEDSK